MKSVYFLFFAVSSILFSACQSEDLPPKNYLFLSHIYQWGVIDNNKIDYRLKDFDFKNFDQIWLGGDLCARTSERASTINYLDSIFDLSSPNTHWAIGNHDISSGNIDLITEKTQRKSFNATFSNGIGIVVLNTTEFYNPNYNPKEKECELLDGQIQLLNNISDTISAASHLIILHHNALINNQMTEDSINIGSIFNFYHPEYFVNCKNAAPFKEIYFPIFKRIQNKGVQVILIGGDLGQRAKEFEFRSKEGIYFLGSGINNSAVPFNPPEYVTNTEPDKLLVFKHDISNKELSWEFVELNDLIKKHKKSSIE